MRWWDVPAVKRIEDLVFSPDAWSAESFISELAAPGRHFLVAAAGDGKIVAYAGVTVAASDADVATIAVDPGAQGQGLGRSMLTRLLAHASTAGARQLFLEVRADGTRAQALYESLGFERIALRKNYYAKAGIDGIVMRLRPLPKPSADVP